MRRPAPPRTTARRDVGLDHCAHRPLTSTRERGMTMGATRRYTNLTTGGPVHVDVEDGKIVRIIPLQLDETDGPSFTIKATGPRVHPAQADHPLPVDGGAQVDHLLAQPHPHAAQARGLRSRRRAQHRQARRVGLRAHQLGRRPGHGRRTRSSASSASTVRPPC